MKSIIFFLLISLSTSAQTQYGALINAPAGQGWLFQKNIANQLGISCLRLRVTVPSERYVNPLLNSGYKIVMNFNSDGEDGELKTFRTDRTRYKAELNTILNSLAALPAVAVIENEEANRLYYSGSAAQYIRQLKAAINVMHARGIKVANGGITSTGLNYLVYQDYVSRGKYDSAEQFKRLTGIAPKARVVQERGAVVDTLLSNYANMRLDYVNFHWKGTSPNATALTAVVHYLKKRTGKPVISNELGQFDDDPQTVMSILDVCTAEQFPYALWYSPDENDDKKDTPLQHSNGTLTPSGIAYKIYVQNAK